MSSPEFPGTYRSGYTMVVDGEHEVCRDNIIFEAALDGESLVGIGEPDSNGCRMRLRLKKIGERVVGLWQEVDSMDRVVFGGEVELSTRENDGRFSGEWTMDEDDGFSKGFWALIKLQD